VKVKSNKDHMAVKDLIKTLASKGRYSFTSEDILIPISIQYIGSKYF